MAVLNEEQEMLRDMAREWTVNESPVTEFRKVRPSGEPEAFNRDAYATMAQMGWAGVIIPEEHGGSDFGFLSAGLVVEELGKTLTASPLVMNTVAASAIVLGGSDEQKARWLPRLASGEAIATLAVDEGPSHDPAKIETSVSDGKLSGTKAFVHEAQVVAAIGELLRRRAVEGDVGMAALVGQLARGQRNAVTLFDQIEPVLGGDHEQVGAMRFVDERLLARQLAARHAGFDRGRIVVRTFVDSERRNGFAAGELGQPFGLLFVAAAKDDRARGDRRCAWKYPSAGGAA